MKTPPSDSFEGQLLALVPSLRRYARSLTRSDTEGEDLLQDCVEKALTKRPQWRGTNLRGWTLTIMTNLYRNAHRPGPRQQMVDLETAADIPAPDTAPDPLARSRLEDALNSLPEDGRAVLMLVVVEGYSYGQVADMLGIPIGTVMSRLSRARRRLVQSTKDNNIIPLRRQK